MHEPSDQDCSWCCLKLMQDIDFLVCQELQFIILCPIMNQYANLMCKICEQHFEPNSDIILYMSHVKECQKKQKEADKNAIINIKIPTDTTNTVFIWKKEPKRVISKAIYSKTKQEIKQLGFQQKQAWFRNELQKIRIPWVQGADWIKIMNKNNILMESIGLIEKINMRKEVKIQFVGEKVNDAGGLLREWIHMIIKEIFDHSTGIFTFANTDDTMYKLKWDEQLIEEFSSPLLDLLGVVIAKALLQRTPINCYLDRTILRQICNQQVKHEDIYGYDKQLYSNWKFTLEEDADELDVYFVTYKNNGGEIKEIELLQGQKDVKVTNENKALYVQLCIQMQTILPVTRSIKSIMKGIRSVFSTQLLEIFEPYQLEMLLYGVPFIDIQDWYDNTIYKEPYSKNHSVIKWFWEIMQEFGQEQLGRILHFCTGSTRTPIHGFSRLESNRGNYSKFLIVSTEYTKKNPFPKAHTCFNRLEMPLYKDREELRSCLTGIAKNELDGIFGLD